jgi:hypothetical protein
MIRAATLLSSVFNGGLLKRRQCRPDERDRIDVVIKTSFIKKTVPAR